MSTEEKKTRRTFTPEERAARLREQADATEMRGRLAAIKAHPVGGPLYRALDALDAAFGAPGSERVSSSIEGARAEIADAIGEIGLPLP